VEALTEEQGAIEAQRLHAEEAAGAAAHESARLEEELTAVLQHVGELDDALAEARGSVAARLAEQELKRGAAMELKRQQEVSVWVVFNFIIKNECMCCLGEAW
jgi:hypothetical protein